MTGSEIGIVVVGALVGWWGVSFGIDKVRELNSRPSAMDLPPLTGPAGADGAPAMTEAEAREVLGVTREAADADIYEAYASAMRQCELVLASTIASADEQAQTRQRQRQVQQALDVLRKPNVGSA